MQAKHEIIFQPGNHRVMGTVGATVQEVANEAGLFIRGDCGGNGTCGKCSVIAEPQSKMTSENLDPDATGFDEKDVSSVCLACQTIISEPLSITVSEQPFGGETVKGKSIIKEKFPVAPLTNRYFLNLKPARKKQYISGDDLAGLITEEIERHTGHRIFFKEPECLYQLSLPENADSDITLVHHATRGVTSVFTGQQSRRIGITLDIGTTSLAAYFCDMVTGEVVTADAAQNPQQRIGLDILSRISAASRKKSGLQDLRNLLVEAVNSLIDKCLTSIEASAEDIDELTVVGNTTMEQIFSGIHPHSIGRSPYMPVTRNIPAAKAGVLGLNLSPGTNVYFFPVISGFVGGDILSAVLAESNHNKNEAVLVIDIGTNGEIALISPDGMWATSCATGPAFEGGELSCGMRAANGAVYKVQGKKGEDGFHCRTMGEEVGIKPTGICGSGVIDAIAAMRRNGMVLPNGRFNEQHVSVLRDLEGVGRKAILISAENGEAEKEIAITLQDIRQIQLAKAAMAVGIEFLLRKAGIQCVDKTILTGTFGARFDWQSAGVIGMLPACVMDSAVSSRENLAGIGGVMALLDAGKRYEAEQLARKIQVVELTNKSDFTDRFAWHTGFPSVGE